MGTAAKYVEINAPAERAYAWWRGLTNLPQIFPDLESVQPRDGTQLTHWKARGPLGKTVEWDALIVEDVPNQKIAWKSVEVPGSDSNVATSGVVRFDAKGATTGVEVAMDYDPPAGAVGEVVAKLFADPQDKVERALAAFKERIESAA